jgi:hypothetical protein
MLTATTPSLPVRTLAQLMLVAALCAQEPPPGGFPPDGPFGRGGPGGPMAGDMAVLERFDHDRSGWLDAAERKEAREWLLEHRSQQQRGPGRRRGRGFGEVGPGASASTAKGVHVSPDEVASHSGKDMFAADAVRTWFLSFDMEDWREQLAAFYRTDVDVPCTLKVDGRTYENVGAHFRGNTSYMMSRSNKKSLHLDFNFIDSKQRVYGHRAVNLINNNDDPTLMHEALAAWIGGQHTPTLRATLARVVINGEDYGVYSLVEHFDKDFTDHFYGSKKGSRFKVPPDFSGGGALVSHGPDGQDYRRNFQIKSDDDQAAFQRLAELCELLEHADDAELVARLPAYLAIDEALWFLAIDNAVVDGDGYYGRGSDYSLHPLARDGNEILGSSHGGPGGPGGRFGPPPGFPGGEGPGGPDVRRRRQGGDPTDNDAVPPDRASRGGRGRRGGRGGPTMEQGPLAKLDDANRPLVRRLLNVPAWRARYLGFLHTIASRSLDWDSGLGEQVARWRAAIGPLAEQDAHSLFGYEAFEKAHGAPEPEQPTSTLEGTVRTRQKRLLDAPVMQGPWPAVLDVQADFEVDEQGHCRLQVKALPAASGKAISEVDSMRLHYMVHRAAGYEHLPMQRTKDGSFEARVEVPHDDKIRFWVEAEDAAGRVKCMPSSASARPYERNSPHKRDS